MPRIFFTTPDRAGANTAAPLIALYPGERGYVPVNSDCPVSLLNPKGCTDDVIEAAIAGSMFGWDCPAARPALDYLERLEADLERAH